MRFPDTFTGKKDGIKARRRAARPNLPPYGYLYATTAPYPPLEATTPLTSSSRALGTFAKLTSVTEITEEEQEGQVQV